MVALIDDGFILPANVGISIQNRTTYNFEEDHVWTELNDRIKELTYMIKAREGFLKKCQSAYQTNFKKIYDPDTGEAIPKLDFDVKQVLTTTFNG